MLGEVFGAGEPLDWPSVVLPRLIERLGKELSDLEEKPPAAEHLYSWFCGALRPLDLEGPDREFWGLTCRGRTPAPPPSPDVAAILKKPLDEEALKRLGLLIVSIGDPVVGEIVRQRCVDRGTNLVAAAPFVAFAGWGEAMKVSLLLGSPSRLEEFARKWVAALGARIDGESEKESVKRLKDLDLGGAIGALERARLARERNRRPPRS